MPNRLFGRRLLISIGFIILLLIAHRNVFAVSLVAPQNGSYEPGYIIGFVWDSVANASVYHFQYALDSSFSNVGQSWPFGCETYINCANDNTKYYWRVRAKVSGVWSNYSEVWSVINGLPQRPVAPILNSPADGSVVPGRIVTFKWNSVEMANDYLLQIAFDLNFFNRGFDNWVGNISSYSVPGFPHNGMQLYWRVAAKNEIGISDFSIVRSFISETVQDTVYFRSTFGTGIGVLNNLQNHIDVSYDTAKQMYYLWDMSRQTNQSQHNHSGQMVAGAAIRTRDYLNGLIKEDSDNNWNSSIQGSAVDAHVFTGKVYDYLLNKFNINSYNDSGSSMKIVVETENSKQQDNAFWDGYGVGFTKKYLHEPFSGALDAVAHEWGHAVTENNAGLIYESESGALNEAFSDWIGTSVEHGYGEYNWTMGESVCVIRDLSNPPLYGDPDIYPPDPYNPPQGSLWHSLSDSGDNYGVHTNSGVANKMFYLLSMGGAFNSVSVSGVGIDTAIQIAVKANQEEWQPSETFPNACNHMISASQNLYGVNSFEEKQVRNAWAAVGVDQRIPVIETVPTSGSLYDFGNIAVGAQSDNLEIVIANTGTSNLVIDTIYLSDTTNYTLSGNATPTISQGDSAIVNVTFDPKFNGVHLTSLRIDSNDPYNQSVTISLNGNGTIPRISVSPQNCNFNSVEVNSSSTPSVVTIFSNGASDLHVSGMVLTDTQNYTLTGNMTPTIPPAGISTVNLIFNPKSEGAHNATLIVSSDDPDNPNINVLFSGIGFIPPPVIPVDTTLANQVITGSVIITATNSITAGPAVSIEPSADVTFKAGNIIKLEPGFWAKQNSNFRAYIGGI